MSKSSSDEKVVSIMCNGLLGKKIGMTGIFAENGKYIPVTVVQVGPCVITQVKTESTDGYNALQLGFQEKKESKVIKPERGHFSKAGKGCFAFSREFGVADPGEFKLGQVLSAVDIFKIGDKIDVSGTTKGRGFSGVIRRHGFSGGRMTHGSHSQRIPGSIGCSAWPSRVMKGKKMPGQYGNTRKTAKNLQVVDIRPDENLILIKGAVPGPKSGLVEIKVK